jgi:hypothetical protein
MKPSSSSLHSGADGVHSHVDQRIGWFVERRTAAAFADVSFRPREDV